MQSFHFLTRGSLIAGAIGALLVGVTEPAAAADSWSDPAPGIRLLARTKTGPNQRIHAAFTSLCTSGVRVDARSAQATRITTAGWASAMGATLAVNGDFYRTDATCDAPDDGGGPDGPAGTDGAGCAASGGLVGWAGALLAVVLVLGRSRRRR